MRWLRSALCSRPKSRLLTSLVFLALAQRLDGQPELLLDLVHRLVVEVGDAGVDPQHGLRHAELVLPRRELVVDERAREQRLARVPRRRADLGLAVRAFAARAGRRADRLQMCAQGRRSGSSDLLERRPGERSARCTLVSGVSLKLPGGPLAPASVPGADVVAVGEHAEGRLPAVLAGRRTCAACRARSARAGPRAVRPARSSPPVRSPAVGAVRERFEDRPVVVSAQGRELGQFQGDDPDLGAGGGELDAAVAEGVREAAVHAERATRDLHPRQHLQQPAGSDSLHLWGRLGGGREISCGSSGKAQLSGFHRALVTRILFYRSRHRCTANLRNGADNSSSAGTKLAGVPITGNRSKDAALPGMARHRPG